MMKGFNELYIEADIPTTPEMLEMRWEGVEMAVKNPSKQLICDLVCFCYHLPILQGNIEQFSSYFSEIDTNFSHNNRHELVILAGVVLCQMAQKKPKYDSLIELLVIIAKRYARREYPECLENQIMQQFDIDRINLRKEGLKEYVDELQDEHDNYSAISSATDNSKKILSVVISAMRSQSKVIETYREDSQILWWMSAKWCESLSRPLAQCEANTVGLVLGKEAASFVHNFPGPYSMDAVIQNQIGLCKGSKAMLSIQELVQNTDEQWKNSISLDKCLPGSLQPLHHAIVRARNTTSDTEWLPKFKKEVLNDFTYPRLKPVEYAWMFYVECLARACYNAISK